MTNCCYNISTNLRIFEKENVSLPQTSGFICRRMIVTFDKEYLKVLYEQGKDDKKHRFQPSIIRRYKRCIDYLRHIKKTEELFLMPSLHYETLTGSKAGISSIRVNDQYRIEFAITTREEPVITICNILELSNHYKK